MKNEAQNLVELPNLKTLKKETIWRHFQPINPRERVGAQKDFDRATAQQRTFSRSRFEKRENSMPESWD